MKFNPKFNDFLKENPNISMLKLSWAVFWRIQVILLPISILLAVFMEIAA